MAESKAASPSSPVPQTGEALEQLQTDEQRRFLDTIDELRSLGLDKHKIDLPQLVVVGDQSSGKSSVLDAITRVRFPSNPGTCTTFATELIMRKTSAWRCSIFIQPGECDETTSAALKQFHATCSSPEEVPHWIDKAKECINHHSKFRAAEFSDHILRVSIAGPDIPPLTLVDLPGLIHSSDRPRDKEIVRSLVNKYVSNSRAIILTVITAQYERHLQEALEIAEKGDPSCQRTFGVITKPDQANDQICRDTYVSFAKGTDTRYKQEWHVLKNRGDGVRLYKIR